LSEERTAILGSLAESSGGHKYTAQRGNCNQERQVNRSDFEGQPLNALVVTEFHIEEVFILLGRPPHICWRVNPDHVYASMPLMAHDDPPNGAISDPE
jgi:hypothetical protein